MFKGFGWFQWTVISVVLFFITVMITVIVVAQMRPSTGTKGRVVEMEQLGSRERVR